MLFTKQDGSGQSSFITLATPASETGGGDLSHISQQPAPADTPADLSLPLGLLDFQATSAVGATETFSLYIDGSIPVNGYWKQNAVGQWVNLASSILPVGDKTRIDFSITDGGPFDSDGKADGIITDPGGPGLLENTCPYNPFQPDTDDDGIPDSMESISGTVNGIRDNDVFHNDELFVRQLYRDILGREGETDGVDYWTHDLATGTLDRAGVIQSFVNSPEFQNHAGAIDRLYHGLLGRTPDPCGFEYWLGRANDGMSGTDIAHSFLQQTEVREKVAGLDNGGFVDLMYQTVLDRASDAAGRAYWLDELDQGLIDRGALLYYFVQSDEYRQDSRAEVAVDMLYLGMLDRAPDSGERTYWLNDFSQFSGEGQFLTVATGATEEYHDHFLPPTQEPVALVGLADTEATYTA